MSQPEFVIVDPDRVELKNTARQLFTVADIGQYKAEILARRFNLALGLQVSWCNEPFGAKRFKRQIPTLWCGAVDNHEARQELAAVGYGSSMRHMWIDAGNWPTAGQVIIGNTNNSKDIRLYTDQSGRGHTAWLPVASLLFPSLLQPEEAPATAPDASCADLLAAGEQHLLINDLVAVAAAAYTFKLLYRQAISSFITYVDIDTLGMRSLEITRENLDAYLSHPVKEEELVEVRGGLVDEDGYPLDDEEGADWEGEWETEEEDE